MSESAVLDLVGVAGTKWQLHEVNMRDILTINQKFGVSEIIARILLARQVKTEHLLDFLYPTLKAVLPNPFHLLDMNKAVNRIEQAILNKEKIVIFGDYDVDGATSSALIKKYFTQIGINVSIYIPDRIDEGYGPNGNALMRLRDEGNTLCITVDCGTIAHSPIAIAREIGLDVIVIDHHLGVNKLPDAVAVVNPNRLDENSPYVNLAAVGVSFLLLVGLNKILRERGLFEHVLPEEPILINLLDLVALGTVCDIVKIDALNRAFIAQGLKVMSARKNVGIRVLSDIIGVEEKPDTYQLGFNIGPHINAGGRIGSSDLGARLLSTNDEQEAIEIAKELQDLNFERKELENQALTQALEQAKQQVKCQKNIILVKGKWHAGVIGIVASKLKDKFHLPAVVIAVDDCNIGKASGRSIQGVDLGSAVLAAKLEDLIIEGGGHAMAAGFSLEAKKIDLVYEFFLRRFAEIDTVKKIMFDGFVSVNAINLNLWQELKLLEPFGSGNSEPRFVIKKARIRNAAVVGVNHVRCLIYDDNMYIKGICFNCIDTELGIMLLLNKQLTLLGKITVNYWRGNENIQFLIEDVADK